MTGTDGKRLNKFISETGICSRREADRLIEEGRVQVNGRTAEMGMRVGDDDRVVVGGRPLRQKPAAVYLAYNKPVGVTCTTDPAVPGNIVEAVRYPGRIFPIGRLDKPSEGLILLTNDGDIVNKILRAGNAHEKEYLVTVDKPINGDFLQRMASGVPILDTVTQPCRVRQLSATSFNIILTQGLNRQIRRMTEFLGYTVERLKRVRVMNIGIGGLAVGQWRKLSAAEMAIIDGMIAQSSKTEEASLQPRSRPGQKRQQTGRARAPLDESPGSRPHHKGPGRNRRETTPAEKPGRPGPGKRKPAARSGGRPSRAGKP